MSEKVGSISRLPPSISPDSPGDATMTQEPLHSLLRGLRRLGDRSGGGLSDAELLQRFVSRRDEAAFEVLVWRHGPMVLGVCRRLLRADADAEDAFQATFL